MYRILLIVLLLTPAVAKGEPCLHGRGKSPQEKVRRGLALQAMRFVNTAQMRYRTTRRVSTDRGERSFGTMPEILALADVTALMTGPLGQGLSFEPWTSIVEGFELRLTTDGTTYALSLTDENDPCRFTLFSDERGVIFQGQPMR